MTTNTLNKATLIAQKLAGGSDFYRDNDASNNAGCSIYRSVENENNYYCILSETRIEVNYDNKSESIWVISDAVEPADIAKKMINAGFDGHIAYDSYASARTNKPTFRQLTCDKNYITDDNRSITIVTSDTYQWFKCLTNADGVLKEYYALMTR